MSSFSSFVRHHISRGWRFAVCGGLGATIDMGLLWFLVRHADWSNHAANIVSVLCAVVFVFLANKFFTFGNRSRHIGRQALKFAFVYGVSICSNILIFSVLVWMDVQYLIAKMIAIALGAFWNYIMSHSFVFKANEEKPVPVL